MKKKLSCRQAGITLVEACIALAVTATLVSAGVPSFTGMLERRTLEGRAGELSNDLQYLRSEVVARNRSMRISFGADAGGSCYVIHSGGAEDCTCSSNGSAQCNAEAAPLKTVALSAATGVRLQSNAPSMLFNPVHGTASPTGTIRLVDRGERAIHHVVNLLGRVRTCSAAGTMPGYPRC